MVHPQGSARISRRWAGYHEKGEFLWNAKPRFGKTLSVYDFCKQVGARSILIVTNRPAIANSWYSDYVKFLGDESGYRFISTTDSLKGKPFVLTRDEYLRSITDDMKGYIEFVSLQDLKGSIYFGSGLHLTDKLKEVQDNDWDVLVVDEAHVLHKRGRLTLNEETASNDHGSLLSGVSCRSLALHCNEPAGQYPRSQHHH